MEVRNFDRNGNFIPDLSKVVLPDELEIIVYRAFIDDAEQKERDKKTRRQVNVKN